MELFQIIVIAFAMSIDAFSVALGVGCRYNSRRHFFKLAWHFGLFQFIMPLLGALLGKFIGNYFSGTAYISAVILFLLAYKMIKDANKIEDSCEIKDPTKGISLVIISLATSMDAFGVGLPLSQFEFPILISALIIGFVCAIMTALGVYMGKMCINYAGKKASYIGAAVLIVIGIKFVVS